MFPYHAYMQDQHQRARAELETLVRYVPVLSTGIRLDLIRQYYSTQGSLQLISQSRFLKGKKKKNKKRVVLPYLLQMTTHFQRSQACLVFFKQFAKPEALLEFRNQQSLSLFEGFLIWSLLKLWDTIVFILLALIRNFSLQHLFRTCASDNDKHLCFVGRDIFSYLFLMPIYIIRRRQ